MTSILGAFIQGMITGFIVSIPIGPIGLLTIDWTIEGGIKRGIIPAFFMGTIDSIAAGVILFGASHWTEKIASVPFFIKAIGCVCIFFVGLSLILKKSSEKKIDTTNKSISSIVLVIVSNPATYLSFGIIGILFRSLIHASMVVKIIGYGGFVVSVFGWWIILSYAAVGIAPRLAKIARLNTIIGVCIILSAISALIPNGSYQIIHHFFLPIH